MKPLVPDDHVVGGGLAHAAPGSGGLLVAVAVAVVVGGLGAGLAGTLLCAGAAKLAVPGHLARAIGDLMPIVAARAVLLAQLMSAVEIGAALALSVPATRDAGAVAGLVLGGAFAAVGALAGVRRLGWSCGCFGRARGRPLGMRNVAVGLVVVAVSALLIGDGSGGWAAHPGLPMLGTAAFAVLLAGWLYRDLIADLYHPLESRARRAAQVRSTG
jgi:methylamine utilization protein MauE